MQKITIPKILLLVFLLLNIHCNILALFDSPSGGMQNLEKGRACFDKGDLTCALKYYALASESESDQSISETIYVTLSQNLVTTSSLINIIQKAGTSAGSIINNLAAVLKPSSGVVLRLRFFNLYQQALSIKQEQLQSVSLLLTSLMLLSELFAESILIGDILLQADILANPDECLALDQNNFSVYNELIFYNELTLYCSAPKGSPLMVGSSISSLSTASEEDFSVNDPSLYMINSAIIALSNALSAMNGSSSVSQGLSSFTSTLTSLNLNFSNILYEIAYRIELVKLGIGSTS